MPTGAPMYLTDHDLLDVLRTTDGVASLYLGPAPGVEGAADAGWAARWHHLAACLIADGADGVLLEAVEQAVLRESPTPGGAGAAGLVVFATGSLIRVLHLPGLDGPDRARFTAPACLVPLLAWVQERPPYVLVVTDRAGADITASRGGLDEMRGWSVAGPDDEIERNAPGGWAQLRYQHRAEDSWRHNAGHVARAVVRAVDRVGARLLLVTGDVRAVQLLEERLPARVLGAVTLHHLTGGRTPDGSQESRAEAVAAAGRVLAGEVTGQLLARFAEELPPAGPAVQGADATLDALSHGRVAELLVTPDAADERTAWFGPGPADVRSAHRTPPATWPLARRGNLVDVAVRAALLTGAQVHVVPPGTPGGPDEGVGGLCRFR